MVGKNYTGGDVSGGPVVRFLTPNAGDTGSIPGPGTEILHAVWPKGEEIIEVERSQLIRGELFISITWSFEQ